VRALICLFSLALAGPAEAKVRVKLGTLAPEGSVWHEVLTRMGQRWREASGGAVELKIYPGGVAGDEGDLVRKMRIGQLDAATLTTAGFSKITRSALALQIPMMFESWEELDRVRAEIGPKIAAEMESGGFVLLHWGDAGWIHKFATTSAVSAQHFKKLKLFVRSGDPDAEALWRAAGFRVVPLASTDVMMGFKTGMIEAVGTTPLFALSTQWFGLAKYMAPIPWSPLNGGTLISRATWEKIDPAVRPKLLEIANEHGLELRDKVRGLNEKAVRAMQDRGLVVVEPSASDLASWREVARAAYPEIRGGIVPAALFDEVEARVKALREAGR